jgi:hypothetical protein
MTIPVRPFLVVIKSNLLNLTANGDYEDERGFYIRAGVTGNIKYCPLQNEDADAITKNFTASDIFIDPEFCRKIFQTGTTATSIYVGYGL